MIAVIIPAYNRGELLKNALESLCLQTKKRFITIVVDDASTEDLEKIVNSFSKKLHIIYLKQKQNGGPGKARQRGINWAIERNIELVTFLDSDDLFYPNTIEKLSYEIQHNNANVVSAQISAEDNGPGFIIEESNSTWTHAKMYRTSFLKNNNITFPDLRTNEDLAFNLLVTYNTERCLIKEPLYLWRKNENSITHTKEGHDVATGIDYISAIYSCFIQLNDEDKKRSIINIVNCYNYYQAAMIKEKEIPNYIDNALKEMINDKAIKRFFQKPGLEVKFLHSVSQYRYENKKLYWFKENFQEWISRYLEE